jgi:anti-sigma factor RsiW
MRTLGRRDSHASDEELLLLADRECSTRRAAKLREHLAQCAPCRVRLAALENTLADFIGAHEQRIASQPPASPILRNRLKAALTEAGGLCRTLPSQPPSISWAHQLAGASIALFLVAGSLWLTRNVVLRQLGQSDSTQLASALPRRRLTPGATRAVRLDDLCRDDDPGADPPVNASLERQVLAEYGVPSAARDGYQLDYLITPDLGGSAEIRNLWPQPYSTSWNARVKDDLENHLHTMVCEGKLPLAAAQDEIASDWIAAYKREFHTETPLSNAATLAPPLDREASPLKAQAGIQTPAL